MPQPSSHSPTLAITCGDPAGIGPEVVLAAWSRTAAHGHARLRVVTPAELLQRVLADVPTLPRLRVQAVAADDPRASTPDTVLVIEPRESRGSVARGTVCAAGGAAAVAALETAFDLTHRGLAQAIVTGPLHKEALRLAGHDVPGHTEWLARACGLPDTAASMMLWLPREPGTSTATHRPAGLGVVHVTLHESLARALAHLSTDGIVQSALRLAPLLASLLGRRPRIAIAAVNPHGGEGGLFGDEESRLIVPAVKILAQAGIDVSGPLPADTLFLRASRGDFDGVVAQYHDQGHIPIKLLGMHRAVNITLGLPLVRTSVAHGTAFDIVGTGRADPSSMLSAVEVATQLAATSGSVTAAAVGFPAGAPPSCR